MTGSPLLNAFDQSNAALLTYTVGGDPNKETSLEIFREIAQSGADIIALPNRADKTQPFNISVKKIFLVDLLNPKRSSITNVL